MLPVALGGSPLRAPAPSPNFVILSGAGMTGWEDAAHAISFGGITRLSMTIAPHQSSHPSGARQPLLIVRAEW